MSDIHEALETWILKELSVADPNLNNLWPCPYAKKAWFKNQVNVVEVSEDFWEALNEEIDKFNDTYRVVIIAQQELFCEYTELEDVCMALNRWFAFKKMDIWLLSFQTDVTMVFIQRLSDLDDASNNLLKQGYYDNYEEEDFDHLIAERSARRQQDARNEKETYENDAWWCG